MKKQLRQKLTTAYFVYRQIEDGSPQLYCGFDDKSRLTIRKEIADNYLVGKAADMIKKSIAKLDLFHVDCKMILTVSMKRPDWYMGE
jgi:hypothetical protein